MKSFSEWRESLTPLQGAAPSFTELKGVAFRYDNGNIQETGDLSPPKDPDEMHVLGRFDAQAETVSIIIPRRLSKRYGDSALNTFVDEVVVPDLRKRYSFRKHFVYR